MKIRINILLLFAVLLGFCTGKEVRLFNEDLMKYCGSVEAEFNHIPDSSKMKLIEAGKYIISRLEEGNEARISFVCEHNSRMSHLGQIWTRMATLYYEIENIESFSGGTTPTYVNHRILNALDHTGFKISETGMAGHGPKYLLDSGNPENAFEIFSKRYDHHMNPDTAYIAVSLCYNTEECCPISGGADLQLSMPYEDLQPWDNTPSESVRYDEQCRIIARDMFYMIDYVKKNKDPGI